MLAFAVVIEVPTVGGDQKPRSRHRAGFIGLCPTRGHNRGAAHAKSMTHTAGPSHTSISPVKAAGKPMQTTPSVNPGLRDRGGALLPAASNVTRRHVLQLGAAAAAVAFMPWSKLTPTAEAAGGGYTPALMRIAFSGDPAGAGTERWRWQLIQDGQSRPTKTQAPSQFVYAAFVKRSGDNQGLTQCLRPADVQPQWILKDNSGNPLSRNNGEDLCLDVGNSGYQQAAAQFLIAKCRSGNWTGVYMDEINANFDWVGYPARPAKYPDDTSWRSALVSFCGYLAQQLKAAGYLLAGNLGTYSEYNSHAFARTLVTGGMIPGVEFFVAGNQNVGQAPQSTDGDQDNNWPIQMGWLDWCMANAAQSVFHDDATDPARITYSFGSFLLADNATGRYGADVSQDTNTPYPQCYTDAGALGAPVGSRYQPQAGVWRRDFTTGSVVVNTNRNAITYNGRSYAGVSAVITAGAPPAPAPEMHGAIADHYYGTPGLAALFGPTTTPERITPDTIGRYNHFTGGDGGSIYWTPNTGAWSVHGAIRGHWEALGWEAGPTGYPLTDERATPDGVGRYNHFTGGDGASIYWTPTTGAQLVHGAIRNRWASMGWERSSLGYPTSDEYAVPGGRRSNFAHGSLTYRFSDGAILVG